MNGLEQAAGWLTPLLLLPGVALVITGAGIAFVVYAAFALCREAIMSTDAINDAHLEHFSRDR